MDRRHFIRVGLLSAGGSLVTSRFALAGVPKSPMAGGVYYAAEAPGRWEKKVEGHLPQIEAESSTEGVVVRVVTNHKMSGYKHYIIKHVLLDKNYRFLDEHLFDPNTDEKPESTFNLPEYTGALYALSVCNLHDTWMNMITI